MQKWSYKEFIITARKGIKIIKKNFNIFDYIIIVINSSLLQNKKVIYYAHSVLLSIKVR